MKYPQNLKYRKYFKQGVSTKSQYHLDKSKLVGYAGLQAIDFGTFKPSEIESCRVSIRRKLGKKIKSIYFWIKMYPYISFTKKPVGMRMGKGKGSRAGWLSPVYRSNILYELNKKSKNNRVFCYFKAFALCWRKLSVKSRVILKVF